MTATSGVGALFLGIIALMILEAFALGMLWRYRGRGVAPLKLAANLLAGISLLMAAVLVVRGSALPLMLACLAVALVMHVVDLRMRWSS